MPKNIKKMKRSPKILDNMNELLFKDEYQIYGEVLNPLGGGRFSVKPFSDYHDNIIGKIRGTMRNKIWINKGDIVLISKREDCNKSIQGDIIHEYTPADVDRLIRYKEIETTKPIDKGDVVNFEIMSSESEDEDILPQKSIDLPPIESEETTDEDPDLDKL